MPRVAPRVAIDTLGCKVNQYDEALLKTLFQKEDYNCVSSDEAADIYIVNSCTVTAKADQEAKYLVRHYQRKNPKAMIVMTGCYAQTGAEALSKVKGIHYIVGNTQKTKILDIVKQTKTLPEIPQIFVENSFKIETGLSQTLIHAVHEKTRVFLKIQDGCDDFCTFCIIPYARGKSRSLAPNAIIRQVNLLVEEGVKEIVITGVSLGSYGVDLRPKTNLAAIVKRIEEETSLLRLRMSSIEPEDVSDELLDVLKHSKKFCSHFHLPLQAGTDTILKLMRRNYTISQYRELLTKITTSFPDVFIGTDIICGFPAETDALFKETLELLRELPFSKLHVFPYSKRIGTSAVKFKGHLSRSEILERSKVLRAFSNERYEAYLKQFVGKKLLGLVERDRALSRNYLPISLGARGSLDASQNTERYNTEQAFQIIDVNGVELLPTR